MNKTTAKKNAKRLSYYNALRAELGDLVDQLQLPSLHKSALKNRWLDQVVWADKKADQSRRWHYRLRLTTIIGGVILPALVGITFQLGKTNSTLQTWFPYVPFVLSQVIAVSATVEEFCRFGDRWRDYRQMSENLKAEGWQYLQSSGAYSNHDSHQEGYALFASRVESIIKDDVQNYIADLVKHQAKQEQAAAQALEAAQTATSDRTLFTQPNSAQSGYGRSGYAQPNYSQPGYNQPGYNQPGYAQPGYPENAMSGYANPANYSSAPGYPNAPGYANAPSYPPAPTAIPVAMPTNPLPAAIMTYAPAPHPTAIANPPLPVNPAPVANGGIPSGGIDLNAAIAAAATSLRGMSTANGPDGGNNACAWTVNQVLQKAGIAPLGDNPNYVPSVVDALKNGRGQMVSTAEAQAGDLVVACGEEHIGISMTNRCTTVLSNSSSRACFLWESDSDFDGYYGGASTIYRLLR